LPDDWSVINREISYDLIGERLLVRVRIDKYNGEQVTIEGQASSILELAANLLRTCRMVGRPEVFTPRTIALLTGEYEAFLALIRPSPEAAPPSDGQTAGPTG
jgi:hypothetical protein